MNDLTSEEALFELLTLTYEIDNFGNKFYRNKNGVNHRIHGPAIIHTNGDQIWCQDGLLHRIQGPAVIRDYINMYYRNGKLHREDGPAIQYINGSTKSYYINGDHLTKEKFIQWQKDNGIKPIE